VLGENTLLLSKYSRLTTNPQMVFAVFGTDDISASATHAYRVRACVWISHVTYHGHLMFCIVRVQQVSEL
jgi:hypothetical protein